jgi:hypothetical protein
VSCCTQNRENQISRSLTTVRRRIDCVQGRQEQQGLIPHRQAYLLCVVVVVLLYLCCLFNSCVLVFYSSVEMADEDWIGKGDNLPRRSPRRKGKTCGRPFKAPRPVSDKEDERGESQVVVITEIENDRDIQDREEAQPIVIPFIPDTAGSQKETAQDSLDIEKETEQDKNAEQTGQVSDTTGSTPDIFKSPDRRDTTNV